MNLCKYANALGEPRKGVHALRIPIIDIAFNDFLPTFIAGCVFAIFVGPYWFFFPFVLGIILHRVFCVNTTINKLLFGEM
jgi:hypothetical protein